MAEEVSPIVNSWAENFVPTSAQKRPFMKACLNANAILLPVIPRWLSAVSTNCESRSYGWSRTRIPTETTCSGNEINAHLWRGFYWIIKIQSLPVDIYNLNIRTETLVSCRGCCYFLAENFTCKGKTCRSYSKDENQEGALGVFQRSPCVPHWGFCPPAWIFRWEIILQPLLNLTSFN